LVLGIVVVIVAILGIAVWGATGEDAGTPVASASGGGADAGVPVVPPPATGNSSAISPIEQIERWRKLREQERAERAPSEPAQPAVTSLLAGGPTTGSAGDSTGAPGAADPAATVPLKTESLPFSTAPVPEPSQVKPLRPTPPPAPPVTARTELQPPPPVTLRKPEPVAPTTRTVTVKEGDTLWTIAVRHYGDSNIQEHLDAILAANPDLDPDRMSIGASITLPNRQGVAVNRLPAEKQVQLLDGSLYEVAKGDTLTGIAKAKLGSAQRWQEIYDLNRERIVDPSMLFPGTTLRLPKD
jgi:nucleoid-associated protein YgaU